MPITDMGARLKPTSVMQCAKDPIWRIYLLLKLHTNNGKKFQTPFLFLVEVWYLHSPKMYNKKENCPSFRYSKIYFCRTLNKSAKTRRPSSSKKLALSLILTDLTSELTMKYSLDCNTKAEAAHIFPRLNLLAQDHAYSHNSMCFWNLK